jgi:hypothetical protein
VVFLPAGARSVKTLDKITDLQNPEHSPLPATDSHPGSTICNLKQPYSVLSGDQYQTSYLPNIPPRTNKGKEVRGKTKEETSVISVEAAVSGPMKICSWGATRHPPRFELNCPRESSATYEVFPPWAKEQL